MIFLLLRRVMLLLLTNLLTITNEFLRVLLNIHSIFESVLMLFAVLSKLVHA